MAQVILAMLVAATVFSGVARPSVPPLPRAAAKWSPQPVRLLVVTLEEREGREGREEREAREGREELLRGHGFRVTRAVMSSLPEQLDDVDVLFLSSGWAQDQRVYAKLQHHADTIRAFVKRGGGVVVSQPNPFQHQGETARPMLLPYPITFNNWYDARDVDASSTAEHYITKGLPHVAMPFAADRMTEIDQRYQVLAIGLATRSPSLAVASYGRGRIVVHGDDESMLPQELLRRMVIWAAADDA